MPVRYSGRRDEAEVEAKLSQVLWLADLVQQAQRSKTVELITWEWISQAVIAEGIDNRKFEEQAAAAVMKQGKPTPAAGLEAEVKEAAGKRRFNVAERSVVEAKA
eukprot:8860561-Heterocapsa_arctica.AAC.1